jgi:hypothetical protein
MKRYTTILAGLFLLLWNSGVTMAQDSLNIQMLGEVHDFVEEAFDVALAGNYAYVSSGLNSGLRILDLSDPAAPVEVGYSINTDPCPGVWCWMTDRIQVSGDRAFLLYFDGTWAFGHYRLYVYDVCDPASPRPQGFISLPDNCTSLFVEGDYVYVTSFEVTGVSDVRIIDVSDPAQPVVAGYFGTTGMPQEVVVNDGTAYIADNDSLVVFDVSDPGSPRKLGSYAPQGGTSLICNVAVQGDHIYITDIFFGIRILDVSDPAMIEERGSFPHSQNDAVYSRMKISDDRLCFVQDGDVSGKELIVLDLSDPGAPVEADSHELPGFWWCYGFDYCDGCVCVAGGRGGLRFLEISPAGEITDLAVYDPYELTTGLAVSDDHAFVGTYMNDLVIYDVSNPSIPKEVTCLKFPDSPIKQISVWNDYLYVPGVKQGSDIGVGLLDITDPSDPREIAFWAPPPECSGLAFSVERHENYAVLSCALGGVEIYDVSKIDQPVFLDNWTLWDPAINPDFGVTNVRIAWPYLFAPDRAFGLYVLDISDPADIRQAASCATPGEAMWADLSADHRHVYVANAHGGLRIIDVSNPEAPAEVGFNEENLEMAVHVAVCGDSVYVADGGQTGLHVFDVSDPADPVEVAWHKTPGAYGHDVVVSDGRIYFLDFTHLEIFEVMSGPTGVQTIRNASVAADYGIHAVYPNPFNNATAIIIDLAEAGHVTLHVYNSAGQKIETIADDYYQRGRHTHLFHANHLPSGLYIVRFCANGKVDSRKLTLIK